MNTLDALLQSVAPMVMVPRYEALTPIQPDSHRFLAGSDGIYLEVDRPWLHGVFPYGASGLAFPYGKVDLVFNLNVHTESLKASLSTFIREARAVSPNECAAWLTYHPDQGELGFYKPQVFSAGQAHISYERPNATPISLPAFDCHSHGVLPAFFSKRDNCDDLKDDLKIAIVVGNLDREKISVVARLVGIGLDLDLSEWVASFVHNNVTEIF